MPRNNSTQAIMPSSNIEANEWINSKESLYQADKHGWKPLPERAAIFGDILSVSEPREHKKH